jgi:hypothetical protein
VNDLIGIALITTDIEIERDVSEFVSNNLMLYTSFSNIKTLNSIKVEI